MSGCVGTRPGCGCQERQMTLVAVCVGHRDGQKKETTLPLLSRVRHVDPKSLVILPDQSQWCLMAASVTVEIGHRRRVAAAGGVWSDGPFHALAAAHRITSNSDKPGCGTRRRQTA